MAIDNKSKPGSGKGHVSTDDTAYKKPVITRHPSSQMVKSGGKLRLSVSATGIPVPKFRWRFNGCLVDGVVGNTLVVPSVRPNQGGVYTVEAYNVVGTDISRAANVTVVRSENEAMPVVQVIPSHLEVEAGKEFLFVAELTDSDDPAPRYQWYKDGKRIRDANLPNLRITHAKEKYVGSYTVVVETRTGVVQSEPATLELKAGSASAETPETPVTPVDLTSVEDVLRSMQEAEYDPAEHTGVKLSEPTSSNLMIESFGRVSEPRAAEETPVAKEAIIDARTPARREEPEQFEAPEINEPPTLKEIHFAKRMQGVEVTTEREPSGFIDFRDERARQQHEESQRGYHQKRKHLEQRKAALSRLLQATSIVFSPAQRQSHH